MGILGIEGELLLNIKLFVCCHSPEQIVPKHSLLIPVQVGAVLAPYHFQGFFHDDTGDNISKKNRSYCELTAQYWAWKNIDADYYGLFHYRRYLLPDTYINKPYVIKKTSVLSYVDKLELNAFEDLLKQYDVILPKKEEMYVSVREHYAKALFHHKEDLELIEKIIREKYPEYISAMDIYLSSTKMYFGNLFIMKKKLFFNYSRWLFDVLNEFDKRSNFENYSQQELRVDGYIAERLLGIYIQAHLSSLKLLEVPKVHFLPNSEYCKQKIISAILPPGSSRRAIIKRLIKRRT